MTNLNNHEIPNFKPNLILELDQRAYLTDIISPSNIRARGLLCNQKVKNTIKQYNLGNHTFFEAKLLFNNSTLKYWWFHPIRSNLEIIDFQQTTFYETDFMENQIGKLDINSIEHFKNQYEISRKKLNPIRCKNLTLKNSSLDLLIIPEIHDYILISERLTKELKQYSGLEVKIQD